jgi:hypothetical protein
MDQKTYDDFSDLVTTEGRKTEVECGNYLYHALFYLLPSQPVEVYMEREHRNFFGSSDFIVSAKLRNDQGREVNYAYIWELKAPQSFLFEPDDNRNRFRPTQDFIKAENQLLHYYSEAEGSSSFRERYKVMTAKNIRMGGIIIGRTDRFARGLGSSVLDEQNVTKALSVRENYLYTTYGIRILTWDTILKAVKP